MLFLLLSIVLSVLLLLNFRLFPRYDINTFQAIVFNYPVCFLTGWLLMPAGESTPGQSFSIDLHQTWTWMAFALGVGFIVTFLLAGASTQRMGITVTSLANNLSLVIPVCFSLFVFSSGNAARFDALNYIGLVLAIVAVGLSTYRPSAPVAATEGPAPDSSPKTRRSLGAVLLPVAVFLCYGATNTTINYMNINYIPSADKTVQVTLTMVLGAIVAGAVMLLIRLVRGQETLQLRSLVGAVTLGIPNFLSFYTLLLALSAFGGNGALVYPIYNIGVILVASAVAGLFFQEKLSTANRVGLGLAVLAIGLLSWQQFV
ncbi:EamA/RhaT family transporter [Spirosoma rhododendri]|uniref:EamA/RhaT family transporter n=1 Tax=Spirosoma rhododendri TaxID=2728024 RepID=A0A7L5DQQ6_9BACT|nr:EamA/RhaT family transporter [Spirosoma rhododendri]QJD80769.1 EamA/RhaT family transporter [Spirosoma rhododendri]